MPDPQEDTHRQTSLAEALNLSGGGVVTLVGAGGKTTLMFALAHQLAASEGPVLTTTTTKIQLPTAIQSPHRFEVHHAEDLLAQLDRLKILPGHLTALSPVKEIPEKRTGLPPEEIDALAASGRFRWIIVEADGAARKPLKAPAAHEPVIPGCSDLVVVVAGMDGVGRPLDEAHVHRAKRFSALSERASGETVTPEALTRVLVHPEGGLKGIPEGTRVTIFLNKADTTARMVAAERVAGLVLGGGGQAMNVVIGTAMRGRAARFL